MPKEYKINPKPDGFDIIEVDKQFSFTAGTEAVVASVKGTHLKNAIYFTRKREIDELIAELTGALRIAKDCCDNPHTTEQLVAAIASGSKFMESINETVSKLKTS